MEHWQQAWSTRTRHFSPQIGFARPNRTLAVSLTGDRCALDCAHCAGYYLKGMVAIEDADAKDMASCLISGGCDAYGRVPVTSHMAEVEALRTGRILNWHVGMIAEDDMRTIASCVDIVSFDFVGDTETIREVYGLDYTVEDYANTYAMLRRYAPVVPHLTLGLRGGLFSGEYAALRMLKKVGLDALVLLILRPTPGTRYEGCQPPAPEEVAAFLLRTRCELPDTPIYLGCMRPGGRYRRELDPLAVRAGINTIVNPAPSAVREARELGLSIQWRDECCVIQRS
jgi:uncharacterized radical SAM superfamily protein